MTKISKFKIDPSNFGHYVNNLWSAFTLMDTKEDVRLLFKDLFTHTEYKMFAKRLEIARRLLTGQTYDEIKMALKVTASTISNVNNILSEKGAGYRKANSRLTDLEKVYQKRVSERQDSLERRTRRKLPSETVLADLVKHGAKAFNQKISKVVKRRSASEELIL
jgi:TrpR-related protein YerC/YecD